MRIRSGERGQASVEFALVAVLAVALLLSFIQAGFSAVETMNAVNVNGSAARIAASAQTATLTNVSALNAVESVVPRLKSGLFGGTRVVFRPHTWCPSLPPSGYGLVYLCDDQPVTGRCAGMTSVQVWGTPAMMVPLLQFMSPLDPPIHVQACVVASVFRR
ncbi:MAG: hypothetical protein ACYCZN_01995 [Candidatus Dormibacteria bacterium]